MLANPLLYESGRLRLGPAETRSARWQDAGLAFVQAPVAGDRVSLHWDFVCDVLSPGAAQALEHATRRALNAVNRG